MQMDELGTISTIAGQVAIVSNFSLAAFIRNSGTPYSTAAPQFPSVDEIFAYASARQRIHPDGCEVIWRPNTQQCVPRTNGALSEGTNLSVSSIVPDACLWAGTPNATTGSTTNVVAANPNEIYGICIAWKGANAAADSRSFNCIKVVNLELAPRSNQIEPVVHSTHGTPLINIESISDAFDKIDPGWQSSILQSMKQMKLVSDSPLVNVAAVGTVGASVGMNNQRIRRMVSDVFTGSNPFNARGSIMDRA